MQYCKSGTSNFSILKYFFRSWHLFSLSCVTLLTGRLSTIHYHEEAESRGLTQRLQFIDLFGVSISKTDALWFTLLCLPSLSFSHSSFSLVALCKIYHSATLEPGGPCVHLLSLCTRPSSSHPPPLLISVLEARPSAFLTFS